MKEPKGLKELVGRRHGDKGFLREARRRVRFREQARKEEAP